MVATQPNLAYVVGATKCYMSNPRLKHWEVVKNIFKYVCVIEDLQLTFGSDKPTKVEGFIDFDYVDDQTIGNLCQDMSLPMAGAPSHGGQSCRNVGTLNNKG